MFQHWSTRHVTDILFYTYYYLNNILSMENAENDWNLSLLKKIEIVLMKISKLEMVRCSQVGN